VRVVIGEFVIEGTFESCGSSYVVARLVATDAEPRVISAPSLGGCPVEEWPDMPRALDRNRRQRDDVFGFRLKHFADRVRLKPGDVVALR
jgi:hypothetical protein